MTTGMRIGTLAGNMVGTRVGRTANVIGALVGILVDIVAFSTVTFGFGSVTFLKIGPWMGARDGIFVGRRVMGVVTLGTGATIGRDVTGILVGAFVNGFDGRFVGTFCGINTGAGTFLGGFDGMTVFIGANGLMGAVTFGLVAVGAFLLTKITSIALICGSPTFSTKSIVMVPSEISTAVGIDTTNGTFFPGAVRRISKSFNTNISSSTNTSKMRSPILL